MQPGPHGPLFPLEGRKGHIHPDSMCLRLDKAASEQGVGAGRAGGDWEGTGGPLPTPSAAEVRVVMNIRVPLWAQRGRGPQGQVG